MVTLSRRRRWWAEFWIGLAVFVVALVIGAQARPQSPSVRPVGNAPGFWDYLHVNGAAYTWYESLDEMTRDASAVVVGRITSVTPGRVFAPEPQFGDRSAAHYLNAIVVVDEVLHGTLADPSASKITIELFAPNADAIPATIAGAPTDTSIFFLLNKAVHPATAYLPPAERDAESKYYEIIGDQAVLTEKDGKVSVPRGVEEGQFPTDLAGETFEEVASLIRLVP